MQATLREFEDWLEDSVPDAIMIAYEKALAKLEECLPFEDALVRHIFNVVNRISSDVHLNFCQLTNKR